MGDLKYVFGHYAKQPDGTEEFQGTLESVYPELKDWSDKLVENAASITRPVADVVKDIKSDLETPYREMSGGIDGTMSNFREAIDNAKNKIEQTAPVEVEVTSGPMRDNKVKEADDSYVYDTTGHVKDYQDNPVKEYFTYFTTQVREGKDPFDEANMDAYIAEQHPAPEPITWDSVEPDERGFYTYDISPDYQLSYDSGWVAKYKELGIPGPIEAEIYENQQRRINDYESSINDYESPNEVEIGLESEHGQYTPDNPPPGMPSEAVEAWRRAREQGKDTKDESPEPHSMTSGERQHAGNAAYIGNQGPYDNATANNEWRKAQGNSFAAAMSSFQNVGAVPYGTDFANEMSDEDVRSQQEDDRHTRPVGRPPVGGPIHERGGSIESSSVETDHTTPNSDGPYDNATANNEWRKAQSHFSARPNMSAHSMAADNSRPMMSATSGPVAQSTSDWIDAMKNRFSEISAPYKDKLSEIMKNAQAYRLTPQTENNGKNKYNAYDFSFLEGENAGAQLGTQFE